MRQQEVCEWRSTMVSDGDWERALVGGLVDRENGQLREGATMAGG
jgi:hypothetical protein